MSCRFSNGKSSCGHTESKPGTGRSLRRVARASQWLLVSSLKAFYRPIEISWISWYRLSPLRDKNQKKDKKRDRPVCLGLLLRLSKLDNGSFNTLSEVQCWMWLTMISSSMYLFRREGTVSRRSNELMKILLWFYILYYFSLRYELCKNLTSLHVLELLKLS